MTERKNAFRAAFDALVQAREVQVERRVQKMLTDRKNDRGAFPRF